ncbi:MAG: 6-hydroxymethylpterin diphosphokinase MptE-like protein [Tissierellaceae bacterium]
MILIDNINILRKTYPVVWNRIKEAESSINANLFHVEDTKRGNKTICVEKDGRRQYLHSKYNPIKEAETLIEEYKNVNENTTIIFYGTGLGYHIDLFLEKYPKVNYYIYEPIPEILYSYLSHKSLQRLPSKKMKNMVLGNDKESVTTFLSDLVDKTSKDLLYVNLNSHINIFPEEYKRFLELFKETVEGKKTNLGAELKFQKRWITNSMKNFKDVLSTPNILLEKKGEFKGKAAIIVAAGPSLNEEIENLRYIKENGLAYIFSVGSSINTLIHHNISPHAACTYDPGKFNQSVFKKTKELGIKDIPIIFGSSVGYETLLNYPGDKYHMITSQDSVSNYYLKNKDSEGIGIVFDAPTIAVVTVQLLYEMGFSPIILVGQNLGYRGKERHSDGIPYSRLATDKELKDSSVVKDVYGNDIYTNEGFNSMRKQMEHYIENLPNIEVINTTKGGANIKGARFIELEEIIGTKLRNEVVDDNWLKCNRTNYDIDYLSNQKDKMNRAYIKALNISKVYYDILKKIENFINARNYPQAEKLYVKLDKELKRIENNDFFKTFILPMNRVEYKALANSIDHLNEIMDPYEKGNTIVKVFKNFMDICTKDIEMIKPIYEELVENMQKMNDVEKEGYYVE